MLPTDFSYDPKVASTPDPESGKPALSPYEADNASYLSNIESLRFREPRMFTMK